MDTEPSNKAKKNTDPIHGFIFQLKLLMLFLHRGVANEYSFRLGTEIKEAMKFDDLVFQYTKNDKKVFRLLQAKHRLEPHKKKISEEDLLDDPNGNFSLPKYFLSYLRCKKEPFFMDGVIEDVTLCTNTDFDYNELKNITVVKIIRKDQILDIEYPGIQQPIFYKFNDNILPLLKEKINGRSNPRKSKQYTDADIKDFVEHLVFTVNYPSEEELGSVIKSELGKCKNRFLSYEEGKKFFETAKRGIPIWFNIRSPVGSFTGRVRELKDLNNLLEEEQSTEPRIVCVAGLGGVGKSELARKYVADHAPQFDNKVVWINAENCHTIAKSFRELANDHLKINTKNINGDEKSINSIVSEVYMSFSNYRSLFVFDNAERYRGEVHTYLPSLPTGSNIPRVLITSRNQEWPSKVKKLRLSVFGEDEAVEFIQNTLTIESEHSKVLATTLQYFPLALQQAVAYIGTWHNKLQNISKEFHISDYLRLFEQKTKTLLDFGFPSGYDNDYAKTVFITWDITLEAFAQMEHGVEALDIFHILSYTESVDIPVDMFCELITDDETLSSAVDILKQSSMITLENATINIHKLVQEVSRIKLKEKNREEKILRNSLKLFSSKGNVNSKTVDHTISIWNYSKIYQQLLLDFYLVCVFICHELLNFNIPKADTIISESLEMLNKLATETPDLRRALMQAKYLSAQISAYLGKYEMSSRTCYELLSDFDDLLDPICRSWIKLTLGNNCGVQGKLNQSLELLQNQCTNNLHSGNVNLFLSTKRSIANKLVNLGRLDEAMEMCENVIQAFQKTTGDVHYVILDIKTSIAHIKYLQGKYSEAIEMIDQLCHNYEPKLPKNHYSILKLRINKGLVLQNQGKLDEAMEIYRELIEVEKTTLGENNYIVVQTAYQMALILHSQSKYEEAVEQFDMVYIKQQHILGPGHYSTLTTQFMRTFVLYELGKYSSSEALPILYDLYSKCKSELGNKHYSILPLMNSIAKIHFSLREFDKAFSLKQEILKIEEETLGKII